jgi:hypothetical protein
LSANISLYNPITTQTNFGTVTNSSGSTVGAISLGNTIDKSYLYGSSLTFSIPQTISSTSTNNANYIGFPLVAIIALSSEIGVISQSTATPLAQWRVPFKCKILGVRASINVNDTSNPISFNACTQTTTNASFNSGTQLLSTALQIATGKYTSVDAACQGTLSSTINPIGDDTIIAIYCTSYIGSAVAGAKMSIYYSYAT